MASVTLNPSGDASLAEHASSTNYGSNTTLKAGEEDGSNDEWACVVEFDLSSIPAGSTINSVDFKLYMYDDLIHPDADPVALRPYRATSSWSEGSVTWGTKPSKNTTDIGSASYNINNTGWVTVSITTSVVQDWLDGNTNNYGFYVMAFKLGGTTSTDDVCSFFRSSEYGTSSQRPQLVVDYTPLSADDTHGFFLA